MTQAQALDILKMGHNVFLTGAAGSGKTFVLNAYVRYLRQHDVSVAVTASTGIAATHLNGVTVHAWSGLGIRDRLSANDLREIRKRDQVARRVINSKVLVIDEISMLHHYRLDLLDQVCQYLRQDERPFGGLQVILCGDFFQLPPVTGPNEASAAFAYSANVWPAADIKVCYLHEQHRQEDGDLLCLLNEIRCGTVSERAREQLRACRDTDIGREVTPTKLYPHNYDVETINRQALAQLPGVTKRYTMKGRGRTALQEMLQRSCLAPADLRLKAGAAVMFVKNHPEQKYVNGTLGSVAYFTDDGFPVVSTLAGTNVIARPEQWSIEEDGLVKASIMQVPLRLAWAITVHKSQGMSLDAAEMDLSKSFTAGMGYVALSRVRTLKGLRLHGFNDMALEVDAAVALQDKEFLNASQTAEQKLSSLASDEKQKQQETWLLRIVPTKAEKIFKQEKEIRKTRGATLNITKTLLLAKKTLAQIASERGLTEGTIFGHTEKLLASGERLDLSHLEFDPAKLSAIQTAFIKVDGSGLTAVFEALNGKYSYDELRLARLLLRSQKAL